MSGPVEMRADCGLVTTLVPSPNFGARRAPVDMLVLHYTGMASAEAAVEQLRNPAAEVSAHYVVLEDGGIIQMVPEAQRAWHAGRSSWEGISDTNSRSIGIEIVNGGHDFGLPAFPAAQIASVIALCADLQARHAIRADRVLAHSDVAPDRKQDPGENFPWEVLHAAGIGHLVPETPLTGGRFLMPGDHGEPVSALQALFALYGYGLEVTGVFDPATTQVVTAFQRHFRRTRVDGIADASTITTLHRLVTSRPAPAPLMV